MICIIKIKSVIYIQSGVQKLSEAKNQVAQLQVSSAKQEQLLEQKQMEGKLALQKITETIQNAGVKRNEMQDLRSTISKENIALTERFSFRKTLQTKLLSSYVLELTVFSVSSLKNPLLKEKSH